MNTDIVIVSAVRTAIGDFGGAFKDIPLKQLASSVVRESVNRAGIKASDVDHCVFGNVLHTEPADAYIARVAAINGGLSIETPAFTLNRLCGSGLQSIVSACQLIETGHCNTVVAGGAESMSRVPYWSNATRFGQRMGDTHLIDAMVGALSDPFDSCHMGVTAENIAKKWNITRHDQDTLAVESHRRAANAIQNGFFDDQILPVTIKQKRQMIEHTLDEHVRADVTIDDLSRLRAVFDKSGSVTAGNASGLNDAAASVVLMNRSEAESKGIQPMAKVVGYAFAGVDPKYMGIGPVPAVKSLLAQCDLTIDDIDVFEVNEAFAAQALAVIRDLDLPMEKTNPNGSGVSLGHPIGATGTILAVKALYELQRIEGRYAVATMCIGGGQGIAAVFERI